MQILWRCSGAKHVLRFSRDYDDDDDDDDDDAGDCEGGEQQVERCRVAKVVQSAEDEVVQKWCSGAEVVKRWCRGSAEQQQSRNRACAGCRAWCAGSAEVQRCRRSRCFRDASEVL